MVLWVSIVSSGYFGFPNLRRNWSQDVFQAVCWSINNYLGLTNHRIRKADAEGAAKWGMAYPMGSECLPDTLLPRKIRKSLPISKKRRLFPFQSVTRALYLPLMRFLPHDVVVYDNECHACLLDGRLISAPSINTVTMILPIAGS